MFRRKSAAPPPEPESGRYHGFRLTNSRRDRVIAKWLRENKRQAGSIIKELLYRYITGGQAMVPPIEIVEEDEDATGEAESALKDFED